MDSINSALGSIQAILWGERAIAALGVRNVCENYMLVVEDPDVDEAAKQLRLAGFQDCDWSYGSREPSFYTGEIKEQIYRSIAYEYSNLDQHSTRFFFSSALENSAKVVLLPSSYTHISVKPASESAHTTQGSISFPSAAVLLRSFVQTLVREPIDGMWTSDLSTWAISYVYGEIALSDDVLDGSDDEKAKQWFNNRIDRFGAGLDRTTVFKRLGRVGYDASLAKRTLLPPK